MLRYKFRLNPFLREALYIGLFYEYWRKRESIIITIIIIIIIFIITIIIIITITSLTQTYRSIILEPARINPFKDLFLQGPICYNDAQNKGINLLVY